MIYFITVAGAILLEIAYQSTEIEIFKWLGFIFVAFLGMLIMANTIKIENEDLHREAEMSMAWRLAAQQRSAEENRRKRIAKQKMNKAKRGY
ncbi:hypothetical protein L6270_04410 [Candidatus Parcubacteria bacterium]|nr:hypothetical protein [Patescibacteria group bacterium]MBU4309205.1 hypothetical protein [Patescibacteria group bacterium]MBU4432631.1 hypothetical protein [Patescibacteria group bacterium]MBU4577566.1 hypothetical protein [Patescibacteria group bacterium]MCG2697253.1 hypothetical protein [Candidatus Parcubacteria bacterium]